MNDNGGIVLEARGVKKSFHQGPREVRVLEDVNLALSAGKSLAIVGASGAGKSTLLHILGGLDRPDAGEVKIEGSSLWGLKPAARSRVRNYALGFVYQFHHLLGEFTAMENVAMPLLIRGESTRSARDKAIDLLNRVGLSERLTHKPADLSGGERQRVALCRALVTKPTILLCDEPTGNLDPANSTRVMDIMFKYVEDHGATLIAVTHDHEMAKKFDRNVDITRIGVEGGAE